MGCCVGNCGFCCVVDCCIGDFGSSSGGGGCGYSPSRNTTEDTAQKIANELAVIEGKIR